MKNRTRTLLLVPAFALIATFVSGQNAGIDVPLYNTYKATSTITRDTVTNAATVVLKSRRVAGTFTTLGFQVICTKASGTVGGTLTLMGSLDGTNFKAIPTELTQTGVTTATPLDVASQTFIWWMRGSPFMYYQVQWVGTGTMVAYMDARLLAH